jgi:hypothetical protein
MISNINQLYHYFANLEIDFFFLSIYFQAKSIMQKKYIKQPKIGNVFSCHVKNTKDSSNFFFQ